MRELWYRKEAEGFGEALPLGNGSLGAMVYGRTQREKISLNEDTLWSGFPGAGRPRGTPEDVRGARELLRTGKEKEAERTIWEKCLSDWSAAYQPAGTLWIEFSGEGETTDYRRSLSLGRAAALTEYRRGGFSFRREAFCSFPDRVLAIRCVSEQPDARAVISLELPHPSRPAGAEGVLAVRSIAPVFSAPSYFKCSDPIAYDSFEENRALSYAVAVLSVALRGRVQVEQDRVVLESGDFVLLVSIATNFEGFDRQPRESAIDPLAVCLDRVRAAAALGFDALRERHEADYRSLFDRVSLTLGGEDRSFLPTDERLRRNEEDHADNGLAALVFDYGRYLTIASSRPGSQPSNLQGIWNEEMRAPWSSNYTININTQMNYWPVEACALPECHEPLFDFVEGLAKNGARTASRLYGCRGWCSHHNSDLWRLSEPVGGPNPTPDSVGWAYWSQSGAWLARDLWQHYEYTGDLDFLRAHWETLRGAGLFLLDRLEPSDGDLITPMSTSPENRYRLNGEICCLSENCAVDVAITMDLLSICTRAARLLGTDEALAEEMEQALAKLKGYSVGSKGQLLEWDCEQEEPEPQHRHLSPLYGVYPGSSIDASSPRWFAAAERLMRTRGNDATGWGIAWKVNVWARLKNGEEAKDCLDKAMRLVETPAFSYGGGGGLYANLLDAHPPFQIDGNFGIAAGIAEMLVQNGPDGPELLPAVPAAWKSGSVRGLRIKGGQSVSFSWQDGRVTQTERT